MASDTDPATQESDQQTAAAPAAPDATSRSRVKRAPGEMGGHTVAPGEQPDDHPVPPDSSSKPTRAPQPGEDEEAALPRKGRAQSPAAPGDGEARQPPVDSDQPPRGPQAAPIGSAKAPAPAAAPREPIGPLGPPPSQVAKPTGTGPLGQAPAVDVAEQARAVGYQVASPAPVENPPMPAPAARPAPLVSGDGEVAGGAGPTAKLAHSKGGPTASPMEPPGRAPPGAADVPRHGEVSDDAERPASGRGGEGGRQGGHGGRRSDDGARRSDDGARRSDDDGRRSGPEDEERARKARRQALAEAEGKAGTRRED